MSFTAATGDSMLKAKPAVSALAAALSMLVAVSAAAIEPAAPPPAAARTTPPATLAVQAVKVEGVSPHPDAGITPESIQALADRELDRHRPAPGEPAMLSLDQLRRIAQVLTTAYRDAGYPVSTAVVPVQQVGTDRIVRLQVIEGRIGKVIVQGDSRYAPDLLAEPARGLAGGILRVQDLERAVLYARDLPGVSVSSVLVPGEHPGETDVILQASDTRRPLVVGAGVNNHGTDQTGRGRASVDLSWSNPLGRGDVLAASYTYAFDPAQSRLWAFSYSLPVAPVPGLSVIAGANRGELEIRNGALAALGLSGPSSQRYVGGDWKFVNRLRVQAAASLRYVRETSRFDALGFTLSDQEFDVVELGISARRIDRSGGGIGFLQVSARQAVRDRSVYPDYISMRHEDDFLLGRFDALRLQPLTPGQRMMLRLSGQYTRDALPPMEQFGVGGAASVRAFPLNDAMGDRGYLASVEYQVDAPGFAERTSPFAGRRWGELLTFKVFADQGRTYAAGANRGVLPGQRLDGVGVGMGFRLPQFHDMQFELSAATPTGRRDASDGDDVRLFARLGMTF